MGCNGWNNVKNIGFLIAGICAGALAMWGANSLRDGNSLREKAAEEQESLATAMPKEDADKTELMHEFIELQEVAYPFGYGREEWRLVLFEANSENGTENEGTGYLLRMYGEDAKLLQEFPCEIEAEELVFRFDQLCGYNHDLEVFSADAAAAGTGGLLFTWDYETERFLEDPIAIPWYEMRNSYDQAYLVRQVDNNVELDSIYRINAGTRQPVELRRWALSGSSDGETAGHLVIWDCLKQVNLYDGEVEWNELGELANQKYYEGLFWRNLETMWDCEEKRELSVLNVTWDGENEKFENRTYDSREEFLADFGFKDAEPFYEYTDINQDLLLELYFDEQTGLGCGLYHSYDYNYELEEVVNSRGFVFHHVKTEEWAPTDTFSTLSVYGEGARQSDVFGYREIYEYTDDGKLSSFEARGAIADLWEENTEESLLSMDYFYRDDGTLSFKAYHHHSYLFGTWLQSERCYYDELERPVYKSSYVTHGSLACYYIYKDDGDRPAYCLLLDLDSGNAGPEMFVYKN